MFPKDTLSTAQVKRKAEQIRPCKIAQNANRTYSNTYNEA